MRGQIKAYIYEVMMDGVGLGWWCLGSAFLVRDCCSLVYLPTNFKKTTLHNVEQKYTPSKKIHREPDSN
jgi:hypothetical protein